MGRVRCPICSQSTDDSDGYCEFCGNALPSAQAISESTQARAGRALKEARALEAASKPRGPFDPDAETTFGIHQITGFTSTFIAWDTITRYEIRGGSGHVCYHAGEVGASAYDRGTRAANRPWTIEVRQLDGSPDGLLVFRLERPWQMFGASVAAFDAENNALGSVRTPWWSLFARSFDVFDPSGSQLARVSGPLLSPWTFEIRAGGEARGCINKEWGGIARELTTRADTFGLELDPSWDHAMRGLALAATFLIDFVHFEKSGGALAAGVADEVIE